MSAQTIIGGSHGAVTTVNGVETFNSAKNHISPSLFYSGSIKLTNNINITSPLQYVCIHDKQTIGACAASDNAVLGGVFVRQVGTARQSGFPSLGHYQAGGTCIVHTGWQLMDSSVGGFVADYTGVSGTSGQNGRGQCLSFSFQCEGGNLVFERNVHACWVDVLPYSPNFYFRETWVDYNIFCITV